ncbi:unknown [Diachasmimorpha longicaudata entomopoxvirus]|uniref:Uncharacterized protein n=1 Tax=Diachasmimorpha longicaudata entomopoxvirus TaxID=109981 RepID=Q5GF27_9POXV|nr:hypothetical protein FLA14_p501 [Diachasmimorpha longicaudata entomopoxvirus]AAT99857.1 unknown [Diachasmimorpha longicaudata entomopoxvirus]
MLCEGVVNPQTSGIGGGFLGMLYMNKQISMINAREKTPMQVTDRLQLEMGDNSIRAAGIPGAIRGYHLLHQKWGNLGWHEIFEPILNLCKTPFRLRQSQANKELLREHQWYNFSFIGYQYRLVQRIPFVYNPELCYVLGNISQHGPDYFYTEVAHHLISEFPRQFTKRDFLNYHAKIQAPISLTSQRKIKFYGLSYPGPDYAFVTAIQRVLAPYRITLPMFFTILKTYNKQAEMQSFDYYQHLTNQTIQAFQSFQNSYRESNVCIKKNNDAICFTSSINREFGPNYVTKSGIILNNQLNSFPMHYRQIQDLQPPSSSGITFLIYGKIPYLVLAATGGNYAPYSILNTIFYNFQYLADPQEAINARRYYVEKSVVVSEKCTKWITCPREKKGAKRTSVKAHYNLVSAIEDIPAYDNRVGTEYSPIFHNGFQFADLRDTP